MTLAQVSRLGIWPATGKETPSSYVNVERPEVAIQALNIPAQESRFVG